MREREEEEEEDAGAHSSLSTTRAKFLIDTKF
jgi:hypothetical protein